MPKYMKLVRDKIPEIIERGGQEASIRILSDEEYVNELLRKLVEEANELLESHGSLDERADVGEVLEALDAAMGWSENVILDTRKIKNNERGAFASRLYLEEVR